MSHFTVLAHIPVSAENFREGFLYELLAPYAEGTENSAYLDWHNRTDEVYEEWENNTVTVLKSPDGTISWPHNCSLPNGYHWDGNKVVYSKSGKVTSVCKRYEILSDYPVKKLYDDINNFAEEYFGYRKRGNQYGYYSNDNAFYDWFEIGGRWEGSFLTKDGPKDIANKADILWDEMKRVSRESGAKTYNKCKEIFESQKIPENAGLIRIGDDGVYAWGEDCLYKAGETLEEFFERRGDGESIKYPTSAYGIFDEKDGYRSRGTMGWFGIGSNEMPEEDWHKIIQEFITNIPDNETLVMLDCHI